MNISAQDESKFIIKAIRRRLFGNQFDDEIGKADKEELYWEKKSLKRQLGELKRELSETQNGSQLSEEEQLKVVTKYIINGLLPPNGYPKIKNAKKQKRLLKLLSRGEKSKKYLEEKVPTRNLKDLRRDTNKTLKGCMKQIDIKVVSCKDGKMPGFYKIKITPIENH